MRGLHTVPVICWRSVWRWGPAGQHRILGRLVTHRLGLRAFLLLFFMKTWHTSSSLICSVCVGERGVAGGVNGVFFKPAIKLIHLCSTFQDTNRCKAALQKMLSFYIIFRSRLLVVTMAEMYSKNHADSYKLHIINQTVNTINCNDYMLWLSKIW